MPYITSIERIGIEKGLQQGLQQGLLQKAREDVLDILETRFGQASQAIAEGVNQIEDSALLKMLHREAVTVSSLEEFADLLGR